MRSKIACGIRILITQSDLLNVRYAAYSFNSASIFIMNNCCITFGMLTPLYTLLYTLLNTSVFTIDYNIVFTVVNTFVNAAVITGVCTVVMMFVGACVLVK